MAPHYVLWATRSLALGVDQNCDGLTEHGSGGRARVDLERVTTGRGGSAVQSPNRLQGESLGQRLLRGALGKLKRGRLQAVGAELKRIGLAYDSRWWSGSRCRGRVALGQIDHCVDGLVGGLGREIERHRSTHAGDEASEQSVPELTVINDERGGAKDE